MLVTLLLSLAVTFLYLGTASAEEPQYQLGQDSLVNTGKDNGYSRADQVSKKDVHWGWQLGSFYVTGFTRVVEEDDGTVVFLKNVGDEITLWFDLEQDIDRLNDDDHLSISEDKNGWDEKFNVPQQNFGRGMFIVKHTDHTNSAQTTTYRDFLASKEMADAATNVEVFEEGDYEVALDYEIQKPRVDVFGWKPTYSYFNYQVNFKFAVRNGNSMVFPIDLKTGEEMSNSAVTTDGFRLDLAQSRYLDVDVKREVLNQSGDGLTEDIRFNRPANDGSEYTDEGSYTVTVRNRYTGQETAKIIYVGSDEVLRAHAATGQSIPKISAMLGEGAVIAADGSIVLAQGKKLEATFENGLEDEAPEVVHGEPAAGSVNTSDTESSSGEGAWPVRTTTVILTAGLLLLILVAATFVIFVYRRHTAHAVAKGPQVK